MTSSNIKRRVNGGKERLICAPRLQLARQAQAAPQQAREASPDKASTQSLDKGCVIGMLTSNGIPAAASFLVGIAPSKTLPHRQATCPLCALLIRANEAAAPPRPLRRHARSPYGKPTRDQNRPDGRWYRASSRLPIIDFICSARGHRISAGGRLSAQFNFCGVRRRCDRSASGAPNAPRAATTSPYR